VGDFACVYGGTYRKNQDDDMQVYNDLWMLELATQRWEPVKIPLAFRLAPRCGATMVTHKDRLLLFGGLEDNAQTATAFYNDLHSFNFEAKRWFEVNLKCSEVASTADTMLAPRSHAQAVLLSNTLLLYGGMYETSNKEITLDDLWQVDLTRLESWRCLQSNSAKFEWIGDDEDDDEDDGNDQEPEPAAQAGSDGSSDEDEDTKKKKSKGKKKRTGLKGLLKVMERFMTTAPRSTADVAEEITRLATEEELSQGETVQFGIQAVLLSSMEEESEEENHVGALKIMAEDAKGEARVLKWLVKVAGKKSATFKMIPSFIGKMLDAEVISHTAVEEFMVDADEEFIELLRAQPPSGVNIK